MADKSIVLVQGEDVPVAGLRVDLVDALDPRIVVGAVTDATGKAVFTGVPAGKYVVAPGGGRVLESPASTTWVGSCRNCGYEERFRVIPA
ncbi:prealbumin-like fold domain-containing protein [Actinosynnema mirum]|uniref:prealbumin-like fold domain-containing protein n=1 Tax=Actinosynnema mirum TaxID=40567 RepID=UPI00019AB84A|nr:prealbumin-like fold domain-containing protein [Actinosynnema mirum]